MLHGKRRTCEDEGPGVVTGGTDVIKQGLGTAGRREALRIGPAGRAGWLRSEIGSGMEVNPVCSGPVALGSGAWSGSCHICYGAGRFLVVVFFTALQGPQQSCWRWSREFFCRDGACIGCIGVGCLRLRLGHERSGFARCPVSA